MESVSGYPTGRRTRSSDNEQQQRDTRNANGSDRITDVSEDNSETVFLNRQSSSSNLKQQQQTESQLQSQSTSPSSTEVKKSDPVSNNNNDNNNSNSSSSNASNSSNAVDTSNSEPRKCWICYTDETEESPLNSEWRSPCPCTLTAHESCLLDWLADMENPQSRSRNGRAKMLCPQCKSEIVVSRPRSYIVDAVRFVERIVGRLVLPGVVFTLAGTVWAGCCAHGVYSMYFIFGPEEARRIFEESIDGSFNPALNLGLPSIPLVLVFSRTRYADGLLPAIPVLFFASHGPANEPDFELWPPTAAMTFAALPYVKSFYTTLYERLFGKLERKWLAEVQPRAGENETGQQDAAAGGATGGAAAVPENDGQVLMEIDLELQVGGGGDNEERRQEPAQQARPQEQEQDQNQIGGGQMLGLGGRGGQTDIVADGSNLADTVLGALLFPALSASMGGLLKFALPNSWTHASPSVLERGRAGILQTRWGRSVIGGCVFVLLKDVLVLYCRWKLAQTHRKRKVLNYNRKKKVDHGGGN